MKIEPVRYSRLIMQLMAPTPMNALRQARSASPSSERRAPEAAAINLDLFTRGERTLVLPMFAPTVHVSRINLNDIGDLALRPAGRLEGCQQQYEKASLVCHRRDPGGGAGGLRQTGRRVPRSEAFGFSNET